MTRLAAVMAAALMALTLTASASAEPWSPAKSRPDPIGSGLDMLRPFGDAMAGRAGLMADGNDPGLARRPGWDTVTRLDWDALPDFGTPPNAV